MSNERGYCVSCHEELTCIDDDPNGAWNSTCARCMAEEAHDYDSEPYAVFSRCGERLADAPPPAAAVAPQASPEDGERDPLKVIFDAAEQHADDTGEPEMQVGDLEDVIRAAWGIMTAAQREELLASPEVTELLELTASDESDDD